MPNDFFKNIVSMIPVVGDIASAMISRGQSKRDIAAQNAYNHPAAQVARLREAGLPMAAGLEGARSGNQSSLPQTMQNTAGGLTNFIQRQIELKQIKLLDEEIRVRRSEANKNEAESKWLLSGQGTDTAGTNLTSILKTRLGMEQTQAKGAEIANKISQIAADNAYTRNVLENKKLTEEISSIIRERDLLNENIDKAMYDNRIARVLANYQESMSNAQLEKLLRENDLLSSTKKGKDIENSIEAIRYKINSYTADNEMKMSDIKTAQDVMDYTLSNLTYDRVKAEFRNYEEYQAFVRTAREYMTTTDWKKVINPGEQMKAIVAFAYTTVTSLTGQSPNATNILNLLK